MFNWLRRLFSRNVGRPGAGASDGEVWTEHDEACRILRMQELDHTLKTSADIEKLIRESKSEEPIVAAYLPPIVEAYRKAGYTVDDKGYGEVHITAVPVEPDAEGIRQPTFVEIAKSLGKPVSDFGCVELLPAGDFEGIDGYEQHIPHDPAIGSTHCKRHAGPDPQRFGTYGSISLIFSDGRLADRPADLTDVEYVVYLDALRKMSETVRAQLFLEGGMPAVRAAALKAILDPKPAEDDGEPDLAHKRSEEVEGRIIFDFPGAPPARTAADLETPEEHAFRLAWQGDDTAPTVHCKYCGATDHPEEQCHWRNYPYA